MVFFVFLCYKIKIWNVNCKKSRDHAHNTIFYVCQPHLILLPIDLQIQAVTPLPHCLAAPAAKSFAGVTYERKY